MSDERPVTRDVFMAFVQRYVASVEAGLEERWSKIEVDLFNTTPHEVAGALLARQATLTVQLAHSPNVWNGHVAPLFLRSMVDAHISLAWVLRDPGERARQFVLYGLGQTKLQIEHFKDHQAQVAEPDPDLAQMIETHESWLNSQRRDFMTEVNVGSWSGKSTREMASESGCGDLYRFAYLPFSGAAHSMWQHVAVYNLKSCANPLHKYHRVPSIEEVPLDPDYLFRSAKYVSLSYELFDKTFATRSESELPVEVFIREMSALSNDEGGHPQ